MVNTSLAAKMMQQALALALRGQGYVEPNPMVGCVIAVKDRIIGEGFHPRFGAPHAEIEALHSCAQDPRGATLYVSLEPCDHVGKTPPCTTAIINAGIARVVVAMKDPHPLVAGRGLRRLTQAGIPVSVGVLAAQAAEINAPFLTRIRKHRPYVIGKWAQTLSGSLITPPSRRRWISSAASRLKAHQLRARVDAIIVGCKTILRDDPLLTARGAPLRRKALRVVVDTNLKTPPTSRLARTSRRHPTVIFTRHSALKSPAAQRLRKSGTELIGIPVKGPRLDLPAMLQILHDRGATNVLVEGGPTLLAAFVQARLLDEAQVFIAPLSSTSVDIASARLTQCLSRVTVQKAWVQRVGPDALLRMRLTPLPLA